MGASGSRQAGQLVLACLFVATERFVASKWEHFHILLVEDDPTVARNLQDGLEKDGYKVVWKVKG
jgi:hypothetical protein